MTVRVEELSAHLTPCLVSYYCAPSTAQCDPGIITVFISGTTEGQRLAKLQAAEDEDRSV